MRIDKRTREALQDVTDTLLSCPIDQLRREFDQHVPGYVKRIYTDNALLAHSGSLSIDITPTVPRKRSTSDGASYHQYRESYVTAEPMKSYRSFGEGDFTWMTAA